MSCLLGTPSADAFGLPLNRPAREYQSRITKTPKFNPDQLAPLAFRSRTREANRQQEIRHG
jgi:hypothetical protein